jgi:MFS family permease
MQSPPESVESKDSWVAVWAALCVLAMSFGTNWIISVGLADIAREAGGSRSVPATASSLAWFGSGIGGIVMAQVADRIGMRATVIFGSFMIALGLAISTIGPSWPLWIGQGLFVGVLGAGSINAPMYIYVGRWFDRRRGSALALISSGTSLAGVIWPPVFERAISTFGWRHSMLGYGLLEVLVMVPLAARYFRTPPEIVASTLTMRDDSGGGARLRMVAELRVPGNLRRVGSVLHPDGDTTGTPHRVLRRSRNNPIGRRSDAVGAARHRVPEQADLGADF